MATCANCIHHSLCDYNTNISGNGKVRLVYADGADAKCSFFQNAADVVPKSEVEKIFAEIEKIRSKEIHKCETFRERENEVIERKYWEGGYNSLRQLTYWLAELKKKYTEDKT